MIEKHLIQGGLRMLVVALYLGKLFLMADNWSEFEM